MTLLSVWLFVVFVLVSGVAWAWSSGNKRKLLEAGPKDMNELAQRLGMMPCESSSSSMRFERHMGGVLIRLTLLCEPRGGHMMSWKILAFSLTADVPLPKTFSIHKRRLAFDANAFETLAQKRLELSVQYDLDGSTQDMRAFLSRDVRKALGVIGDQQTARYMRQAAGWMGWLSVRLSETARFEGPDTSLRQCEVHHVLKNWPALISQVETLVRAWPDHGDVPELLLERVVAEDESVLQRWYAATELLSEYADSEATAQMRAQAESLPEWVGLACAMSPWEPDTTYESVAPALELEVDEMRRDLAGRLGARFPWEVFLDPNTTASLRDDVFDAAMAIAACERDDAFVGVLTGPLDASENRANLYKRLVASGWEPSHEARVRLAKGAVASIRHELVRELRDREVTLDDAPMLAALSQNGHEGDVAPFIARLSADGTLEHGALSLAVDDEARGGLTSSDARRGDLTTLDGPAEHDADPDTHAGDG